MPMYIFLTDLFIAVFTVSSDSLQNLWVKFQTDF
jgi:hypothetical protein